VRRVHFIFERAVRKFKRDLSLWSAWLQFCRATHSYRRLSRVAARALQLHPMEPGLWMFAASWEFEARGDVPAARSLMQQGLRMCKQSPQLWLEYFNMVSAGGLSCKGRQHTPAKFGLVPETECRWWTGARAIGDHKRESERGHAWLTMGCMQADMWVGGGGGGLLGILHADRR
jgi:hypothetical protein